MENKSLFVGKTVEDEDLGRGVIVDETINLVGVRYKKERKQMKVHYIQKSDLIPQKGEKNEKNRESN